MKKEDREALKRLERIVTSGKCQECPVKKAGEAAMAAGAAAFAEALKPKRRPRHGDGNSARRA